VLKLDGRAMYLYQSDNIQLLWGGLLGVFLNNRTGYFLSNIIIGKVLAGMGSIPTAILQKLNVRFVLKADIYLSTAGKTCHE